MTDLDPTSRLRRNDAAKALTDAGYPIAPSTLATLASRGNGPPYSMFHRVFMYEWGALLTWAKGYRRQTRERLRDTVVA